MKRYVEEVARLQFTDLFGRRRRRAVRFRVELPINVRLTEPDGSERILFLFSEEFDAGGLRMWIREEIPLERLTDEQSQAELEIKFPPDFTESGRVLARLIWSDRSGKDVLTGWEFMKFLGDVKKQINAYIEVQFGGEVTGLKFMDLFGRRRRKSVRFPVKLIINVRLTERDDSERIFPLFSEDFSAGGLRMRIPEDIPLEKLTDERGEAELEIELPDRFAGSARVLARLSWVDRSEKDILTGWEFVRFIGNGRNQINACIEVQFE